MFLSFTGEMQPFEGEEPLYPIFVNESAYYEKGIAMWLTRLRRVQIPPVQVQADRLPVTRDSDTLSYGNIPL